MTAGALQVVVTIWLSVHPVTFTLPKLYPMTAQSECEEALTWLIQHRRHKHMHMELQCVPTDKRAL